jgi:Tetracyclin repressor-like, C-terminal domain
MCEMWPVAGHHGDLELDGGHDLDGGRAGADERDPLAGQVGAVVPAGRVADRAAEPVKPVDGGLDTAAAYFEAHPSTVALWFGGRVSPLVVQAVRARNHALAVRIRALLISHHLVPEQTPLAAADLLVELGDRILEVAFRSPGPPDRQTIELGGIALTAFAERWAQA